MARPPSPHPASDADRAAHVLRALDGLRAGVELHILSVSEPVTSAIDAALQRQAAGRGGGGGGAARASDGSAASAEAPTPASLEADLAHFRDLFAKLRFSYVEQETKEKFIRCVVGDPPVVVAPAENARLEARNAVAKAALGALKRDVAALVARLEERARALARRHERLAADALLLRDLPAHIRELEARVAALRRQTNPARGGGGGGGDGDAQEQLGLPLAQTTRLVDERRARARELDRQLEQLAAQAPRRRKEADRLRAELGPLEARRASSAAAAGEARRRREAALGGDADDLEERARWFRGSEAALRRLLDLEGRAGPV